MYYLELALLRFLRACVLYLFPFMDFFSSQIEDKTLEKHRNWILDLGLKGGWSTWAYRVKTRGAAAVSRRILEYLSVICAKKNFKS